MDMRPIKQIIKDICDKEKGKDTNILFEVHKKNQGHIIFNRPKMMNAFTFDMYFTFNDFIQKINQMDEIKYIVIRGAGGNFSSGNDLNNFAREESTMYDVKLITQAMGDMLAVLTETIVKSKKPIFALVEGRTVGFAFTQLALYDKVFSTKDASFMAPLVKIAQGPEMASSYLFPKIFGQSLAQEIIIKGTPKTPQELSKYNFLSYHENVNEANVALQAHIDELQRLDWTSYVAARKLMREFDRELILKANTLECQNLVERWNNPELPMLLVKYMAERKQKPKL